MNKILSITIFLGLGFLHAQDKREIEGINAIKLLGKTLKTQLKKELKADKSGVRAINFCANEAQVLTKEVNEQLEKGTSVRRTSLKYRNTLNAPDAKDKEVLKSIKGKVVFVESKDYIRVYKPVFIEPVCLNCHGNTKQISEGIADVISKKYPQDLARAYGLGDLRGVMVWEKRLR